MPCCRVKFRFFTEYVCNQTVYVKAYVHLLRYLAAPDKYNLVSNDTVAPHGYDCLLVHI